MGLETDGVLLVLDAVHRGAAAAPRGLAYHTQLVRVRVRVRVRIKVRVS